MRLGDVAEVRFRPVPIVSRTMPSRDTWTWRPTSAAADWATCRTTSSAASQRSRSRSSTTRRFWATRRRSTPTAAHAGRGDAAALASCSSCRRPSAAGGSRHWLPADRPGRPVGVVLAALLLDGSVTLGALAGFVVVFSGSPSAPASSRSTGSGPRRSTKARPLGADVLRGTRDRSVPVVPSAAAHSARPSCPLSSSAISRGTRSCTRWVWSCSQVWSPPRCSVFVVTPVLYLRFGSGAAVDLTLRDNGLDPRARGSRTNGRRSGRAAVGDGAGERPTCRCLSDGWSWCWSSPRWRRPRVEARRKRASTPRTREGRARRGHELSRLTLTSRAAERLDIQTAPVRVGGRSASRRVFIPYAALIYDEHGATWAYTSPKPRASSGRRSRSSASTRDRVCCPRVHRRVPRS